MAVVHKKHEEHKVAEETSDKEEEVQPEPVVVSDVVTETTERIEVIEETTPDPSKSSSDPLTDFKEKMTEEEENPISDMKPKKNFMWPILFVFIIALLMLGGIFIYKNNIKSEKVNVVTLSPTPTIMPEPTKAIDFTKYEIKILNGSGVDGEASRQKENFEKEGFTISSVGNADSSEHTDTIIKAKEEIDKDFLDKLRSVLGSIFTLGETEILSEDATTPIVVILGTKK